MNEVIAFATAIQNYGTDTFTIQCYFFHDDCGGADIFTTVDGSWVRFVLDEEGIAIRVMLLEKTVKSVSELTRESIAILYWASQQPSIVLAAVYSTVGTMVRRRSCSTRQSIKSMGSGRRPILGFSDSISSSSNRLILRYLKR